jgi:hypothetical protein
VQLSWLIVTADEVAAPALDVEVTATTRCVAKKVVVSARVHNAAEVPVAAALESEFGAKSIASIASGANGTHAFTTRTADVAAGSVAVTVTAVVDGAPVTQSAQAAYPATACG